MLYDGVENKDNLFHMLYNVFLIEEEPTVEDFILMLGTFVAFIAFILWCCFPVVPEYYKKMDKEERANFRNKKRF